MPSIQRIVRALVLLVAILFCPARTALSGQQNGSGALDAAAIFSKNKASIVTIETQSGFGSGVIVGAQGLIVTNFHVVEGASKISVTLPSGDVYDDVLVAAVDHRRDLVLLRVAGFSLTAAQLGDSDGVQVGEPAYAIGTPKGLELSISDGIVSAVRASDEGYRVVQTTAAISPGSSGGGLFNSQGMLIGVTTFKIRGGENLNFAIPVNYVRGLIALSDVTMTLAEMNQRFPARSTSLKLDTPSPAIRRLHPDLAAVYRSASTGARMTVRQTDETATFTIYNAQSEHLGNAVVTWSLDSNAFVGTAEMRYVCGSVDTRTTMVKSEIQFRVSEGGVLRERYNRPVGINCTRGQIASWQWGEDSWWP